MISLRHKLWLGFGGLLFILVAVSVLSIIVLTLYSSSLEQVFHENYNSAIYCDAMKESLDQLNARAQRLIWEEAAGKSIDVPTQVTRFEDNLARQQHNITLPGELRRTNRLEYLWRTFKEHYDAFDGPGADRPNLYRNDLLPRFQDLKQLAQQIADMNMNNMVSVDGQVKKTLVGVRNALLILVIAGAVLASLVVWTSVKAILSSLQALTASARRIEAGDLNLNLPVKSRDEIGQLAEAFNSMAARLREFRRLDHDRLERTQQTTQLAIDSLPDAVFIIGAEERVEIANRTARDYFKIEPGIAVADLHLKWLTPLYQGIKMGQKPIEPQGYSAAIHLVENGEERFLLPRAVPMLGPGGLLIGAAVILVDVTRLRRADEAKSNMISTVSHELRTPLTGVRMSLSLLATEKFGTMQPQQQRLIAAAREESDRLHRIIDNLLNMSRIEAGRAQYQFRTMNAAEIVSMAVDPLRPPYAQRDVTLDVAAPDQGVAVTADPVSIGLALTNLLSNALKFTPPGGRVRVSVASENGSVRFFVADTGPGIPAEYRSRIFEKFFRVPTQSGPTGAGLGLSIAREIAEAHGGTLQFDCPAQGGAVFTLSLPTQKAIG